MRKKIEKANQANKNINELKAHCHGTQQNFLNFAHQVAWQMQFKSFVDESTKANFIQYANRSKMSEDVLDILNQKPVK